MTTADLQPEIQFALLETSAVGYSSGLYTEAEVAARLNYRLYDFAKQTGCLVSTSNHFTTTAGQRDYTLYSDTMDLLHVAYTNDSGQLVAIPRGDPQETDLFLNDIVTSADIPTIYTIELGDVNTISLIPPPDASSRAVHIIFTRRPTALPSSAGSDVIDLPNDFIPFVKYGVLADLFNKAGETHDPARAAICEGLYQLGVQVVKSWVVGQQAQAR